MPRRLATCAQPVIDAPVGDALQLGVERRADRQAVLVQRLRAILGLDILPHFLDEVGRDASIPVRLAARDDRLLLARPRPRRA